MFKMVTWNNKHIFLGAQIIYIGGEKNYAYQCPAKVSLGAHAYLYCVWIICLFLRIVCFTSSRFGHRTYFIKLASLTIFGPYRGKIHSICQMLSRKIDDGIQPKIKLIKNNSHSRLRDDIFIIRLPYKLIQNHLSPICCQLKNYWLQK